MNSKLNKIQKWPELASEANWSTGALASNTRVSVRTLERFFNEQMGKSPTMWLSEQRQRRAMELLREGFSVKEVASRIGYRHSSTFSREFKKHWGTFPTILLSTSSPIGQQMSRKDII